MSLNAIFARLTGQPVIQRRKKRFRPARFTIEALERRLPLTGFVLSTTTTVAASQDQVNYGQAVNLTATVSAITRPSGGAVSFLDNGALLGTASLTSGTATLSNLVLPAGSHEITASYSGAVGFAASSTGMITTIAGDGAIGFSGDRGAATSAELFFPNGIAVDAAGDLFIADTDNAAIREVDHATGVITTVAGGQAGFYGDNGPATSAGLDHPEGIAVDAAGDLFIADTLNNRIREVNHANGVITTVAGGQASFYGDNGPATSAGLHNPDGIAIDAAGNLFIADTNNNRIREINHASGVITTVAGEATAGSAGDNGPSTAAELNNPVGIAVDSAGDLFIADYGNNRIREVDHVSGIIGTVVGNGTAGFAGDNGPPTEAELNGPFGIAVATAGNLFIADSNNNRIRAVVGGLHVTVSPALTSVAITASQSQLVYGQAISLTATVTASPTAPSEGTVSFMDNGALVGSSPVTSGAATLSNLVLPAGGHHITASFSDSAGNYGPGSSMITTVAGDGTQGFAGDNGLATAAEFNETTGIAVDAVGDLFIADNNRVREVDHLTGIINTIAGNGTAGFAGDNGLATAAELSFPEGVAVDPAGDVFIADGGNNRIREVHHATGVITTVAGGGTDGLGDNGPATAAELGNPIGIAIDAAGDLFITDRSNRIREIHSATGVITTVAGNGTQGFAGDNGLATAAELDNPIGISVDAAGDLFIADTFNNRIREVEHGTGIITTVAGDGTYGSAGDNSLAVAAELRFPTGIAVDVGGNMFIADSGNNRIREVDHAIGVITTIAGDGTAGFTGDNGPADLAELKSPFGIAVVGGKLFFSDSDNNRIREVADGLTVTVTPATLTVAADDKTKALDAANPTLTYTITGFVNGDSASVVSGAANISTTATAASDVGSYPIAISAGTLSAADYTFTFQNGTLAITVNSQGNFGLAEDDYVIGSGTATVLTDDGVLRNDSAPSELTVTSGTVTGAEGGTFVFNANGAFTYTPPANFPGFDYAKYTAQDASGDQGMATVNVLSQTGGVVWKFYESVLHRDPDYAGLQGWIDDFLNGGKPGDIAAGFFESTELLNQVITGYYNQYLGRGPQGNDLAGWESVFRQAGGPETIKAGFAASPEFNALAGNSSGTNSAGWVTALYERILNRVPKPDEVTFWQQQLAGGTVEYQVALDFFQSLEAYDNDVTGWFYEYLGRAPTTGTGGEQPSYAQQMVAGASDKVIEQAITNLPEYAANPPASPVGTGVRLPDYFAATNVAKTQSSLAATDSLFGQLGR